MRPEIADLVFPVIAYGLHLRDRLEKGEHVDMHNEQAELRGRLKTAAEAQRWLEYGGDGERFLGARYALTCWLDEIFTLHSRWGDEWKERSLEFPLYETRDRAWKFWAQAKLAQSRQNADALEVYYLCTMLGMRGEGPDEGRETLSDWRDAVEAQINRGQEQTWPGPQEMQPESFSTPRRGRDRLHRIVLALIGVAAVLIPTAVFVLVSLGRN